MLRRIASFKSVCSATSVMTFSLPSVNSRYPFAVLAVRTGACFGAANASVKALQIQLGLVNPEKSANNGFVEEFGLSFNITPPAEEPGATKRPRHPWGSDAGPYYAPDTLHDCNHGIECRQSFGWIDSCVQLSGVCLTVHEHNHAKKEKILHMLNVMTFDPFALWLFSSMRRRTRRLIAKPWRVWSSALWVTAVTGSKFAW